MFIKRIAVAGFGRLRGVTTFQPGKCNIICQDNEFGKTTLVDAILHSFYGFPSTGFKRAELKPREKYRPWMGGDFRVGITIVAPDGRTLLLENDFGRKRPPMVTDADTGQQVPLEGLDFGEKFFQMPVGSFTGCFLLRQDDERGDERGELLQVVEQAAVSNRRSQDAPVRRALEALADCRIQVEEYSPRPLGLDTLLKRIDEKISLERARLAALEEERGRRSGDIGSAEQLDREILRLADEQLRLDYECMLAELAEATDRLDRHVAAEKLLHDRAQRLRELEASASVDATRLPEAMQLFSAAIAQGELARQAREALEGSAFARLRILDEQAETLPGGLRSVTRQQAERLRSLRESFASQQKDMAAQDAKCAHLRKEIADSGAPIDAYHDLTGRLDSMPEHDRVALLDSETRRAELEKSLSDTERRVAEAAAEAERVKSARESHRNASYLYFGAAAAALCGAVPLFLLSPSWSLLAGAGLLLAAAGLAIGGFLQLHKAQQLSAMQLEPVLAREVSASAEAGRLREKLDTLEHETAELMQRHGVDPALARRLRDMGPWARQVGAYQAAEEHLARMREALNATSDAALELVRLADPDATAGSLDAAAMERTAAWMESVAGAMEERVALDDDINRRLGEIGAHDTARDEKRAALEAIIGQPAEGSSLEQQFELFKAACGQSEEFHRLTAEAGIDAVLPEDEAAHLRQRAEVCRSRLAELADLDASLEQVTAASAPRAALQEKLSAVQATLHEMKLQRMSAFLECDRAIETWRRDAPRHREEIERLDATRAELARFQQAARIAHAEVSTIAERVFSQWATELNKRANEVLADISGRYSQMQVTNDLEISVHSAEINRRLEPKEIAHLSKGTRDQIALALRVAVAEYLTEHAGRLPLVFDEPFAHWDDSRFAAGMRLLGRLAERHQVIAVSCHRWRYDRLLEANPDLADRLHFCDLAPLDSPATGDAGAPQAAESF